jgi:peptidoglycan hydrolase CwlO-like protein
VARRKYAIDRASREAVLLGEALRDEADRKLLRVENTLREAYAQEARVKRMQEELSVEQHEVYAMQMTAQTQMMEVAGLKQGVDYLQKELAKAEAKIQKLKRRGPQKPKPVDFGPMTG